MLMVFKCAVQMWLWMVYRVCYEHTATLFYAAAFNHRERAALHLGVISENQIISPIPVPGMITLGLLA